MNKVKFGCVMFDLHDNVSGKPSPRIGSGWCSIDGNESFRFKNIEDIILEDIYLLSNIKQDNLWKSGAGNNKKIKHSGYLRTDLGQIMKETGLIPPKVPIANICQSLSEIFTKVMKLSIEFYNIKTLEQKDLYLEIKNELNLKDENISPYMDEALMRAYQDLVICENYEYNPNSKEYLVTLKRPRYFHSKEIFDVQIPLTNGDWDFFGPDDLPESNEDKLNFFLNKNKPFLVKIKINKFNDINNFTLEKFLNLGEAIGDGGRKRERNWVCQPELLYLKHFADITIDAGFVAHDVSCLNTITDLPFLGELSDFSYSLGLLSECVWTSLATRSINPNTRSKTLVSPRACWVKSADRFLTFTSAMILNIAGFKVISYGFGGVTVAVKDEMLPNLIETAPHAGLTVPLNIIEKINTVFN